MFPTSIPSEETYSARDAIVHILMSNFLSSDGLIPWGNNKFHEFILYKYNYSLYKNVHCQVIKPLMCIHSILQLKNFNTYSMQWACIQCPDCRLSKSNGITYTNPSTYYSSKGSEKLLLWPPLKKVFNWLR